MPPAGDWERYHLLLWNRSALVLNTTLEKDTTEYLIRDVGLIPGKNKLHVEVGLRRVKTTLPKPCPRQHSVLHSAGKGFAEFNQEKCHV